MFQRFDEDSKKVLKKAKLEMQELKHPFVGSEHLLLSILKNKDLKITNKLNEYNINYQNFKDELINIIGIGNSLNNYFIYTPLLKRIIENAIIDTKEEGLNEVNVDSLVLSLLDEGEGVAIRILNKLGVNIDELYMDLLEKEVTIKPKSKKKLSLYEYGIDLCKKAIDGKIDPVIGRDSEINRLIEILLRRNKNNPLLIGEAGVGKTAIVEGLALKIVKREVPDSLLDKKIISISMASLVAGTKYRGEFEEKINKLIKEIENNSNLIIFIDEMHSLVGAGGAEGAIDASNIFKPSLARGKIKLIGATTTKEYKNSIEKDKALARRFQTVLIKEPNLNETKDILLKIKPIYENFHNVIVPNEIIDLIVNLTDKYIFDRKNPDKSIDILDEVCATRNLIKDKNTLKIENLKKEYDSILETKNKYIINHDFNKASLIKKQEIILEDKINKLLLKLSNKDRKIVTSLDVSKIIKNKSNIPVYEIEKDSNKILKNLDTTLNHEIFGQENAIRTLCFETKKIKLGLKNKNKPVSFLFTGKSGVGKTELVKLYAKTLNMNLIRLDGSEYRESHTTSKILGSPPGYIGYQEASTLLDEVKNNPYSVILIDEIEKISSSVINLFLQILDEGFITNSNMEKVYFNHAIIIMTSNITSNINSLGFNQDKDINIKNKLESILNIEFINRINHIIQFENLSSSVIKKIVHKEIFNIKKSFKENSIELIINNKVIEELVNLVDYDKTGAREVKRLIEDKIDNIVIDSLLEGKKTVTISSIK